MKSILKLIFFLVASGGLFSFAISNQQWNIAHGYSVKFSTKRAEGTFSSLKGTIVFDPTDLVHSMIDVTVDAGTIKTGNNTKDYQAKSESWLNTEKYPTIRFKSSFFFKSSDKIVANGTIELHGVQKPVQIFFNFQEYNGSGNFAGHCSVKWRDFGIKGNALGIMVGDEVYVTLNVPVTNEG